MAFIPNDRPVLGKDLDAIRQSYGITTTDACFLFGLSMTRWMHAVRRDPDLPLADTSLAVLARFMDKYPELYLLPKFPEPSDVFEKIRGVKGYDELNSRHFSLILGAESTAANRWLKQGGRQSPSVVRLLWHINEALDHTNPRGKPKADVGLSGVSQKEVINELFEMAKLEASLRGTVDLFKEGRWQVIKQIDRVRVRDTKRSRAMAAKKAAATATEPEAVD